MRVALVWTAPTHRLSGLPVASILSRDVVEIQSEPRGALNFRALCEFDCIVASCGGRLLNRIIAGCYEICDDERPLIVSVFPGIVSSMQIDALLTRLRADLVCMNSQKDLRAMKRLCQRAGLSDNTVLSGPPWTMDYSPSVPTANYDAERDIAIFAEQDLVPIPTEISNLECAIETICRQHPEVDIFLKSHPRASADRSSRLFSERTLPPNLFYMSDRVPLTEVSRQRFRGVITISSSLAHSAFVNGYPVYILQIDSAAETWAHIFAESGLQVTADEISLYEPPSAYPAWENANSVTFAPDVVVEAVENAFGLSVPLTQRPLLSWYQKERLKHHLRFEGLYDGEKFKASFRILESVT